MKLHGYHSLKSIHLPPAPSKPLMLRAICTVVLVLYFCYTISSGPPLIIATTVFIQMKCYAEIVAVAFDAYPLTAADRRRFRILAWYLCAVANYYCAIDNGAPYIIPHLTDARRSYPYALIVHYRLITLAAYWIALAAFVAHLGTTYDRDRFCFLAWIHVTLMLLVPQSYMIVKPVYAGLIWLCLPVSVVVINDIAAYLFGKRFGRTPLIALSPRKTREGYVFGGAATIAVGMWLARVLCRYERFVRPIVNESISERRASTLFGCARHNRTLDSYDSAVWPFEWHAFAFVAFGSAIAPFGGFFASGFKRAYGLKDFGRFVPGHGGLTDRFDCQFLMATFVHAYTSSFVDDDALVRKLYARATDLTDVEQVRLFRLFEGKLVAAGLVNGTRTV